MNPILLMLLICVVVAVVGLTMCIVGAETPLRPIGIALIILACIGTYVLYLYVGAPEMSEIPNTISGENKETTCHGCNKIIEDLTQKYCPHCGITIK